MILTAPPPPPPKIKNNPAMLSAEWTMIRPSHNVIVIIIVALFAMIIP